MQGLVDYGSSDEDESEDKANRVKDQVQTPETPQNNTNTIAGSADVFETNGHTSPKSASPPIEAAHIQGPVLGPTAPSLPRVGETDDNPPQSPYSQNRSLVHSFTLPPYPDLDIPPSPSGSPPAETTAKFAQFLKLKRQGTHFNARLASSTALANPSLLAKLRRHAGIDDKQQYASTLPKEIWDPDGFPEWAYKEGLEEGARRAQRRREREEGERVDFVSKGFEGIPTQAEDNGSGPVSATERVMRGLDRRKVSSRSPAVVEGTGKKRVSRFDDKSNGSSRKSSPTRRKRSRSR